jgi:hypothetical protein
MGRQILDTGSLPPCGGGLGWGATAGEVTPTPALPQRGGGRIHLWIVAAALLLPSCEDGRNFTLFGYTTCPQYDLAIHTVYVPIFKNRTMWRGMEFQLTQAVVREIEAKTPYKVVSNCDEADTELIGTIINFNKNILNINQLNEVREAETTLAVEVIWRNRRTGDILSAPRPAGAISPAIPSIPTPEALPGGGLPIPSVSPNRPPPPYAPPDAPPAIPAPAPPVLIQSIGGFIPELGQSISTAQQQNVNRLAIQIVSMMEKPW